MKLWYLSHRRLAKAQASLHIHAVSPERSLFAHMKYGSRRRFRPKIRHLAPLDGCAACLKNEFTEDEKCHNLMAQMRIPIPFICSFSSVTEVVLCIDTDKSTIRMASWTIPLLHSCSYLNDPKIGTDRSGQAVHSQIRLAAIWSGSTPHQRGAVWSGSTLFAIPTASFGCITLW